MGRKHRRDNYEPLPLTVTPASIPTPPRVKTQADWEREWRDRDRREHERWIKHRERQRQEINERLRWTTCLVPLCDMHVVNTANLPEDAERRLPLCEWHLATAWRQVELYEGREGIVKATERLAQEQRERDEQAKRRRLARHDGHIYYVRLNGLVKVGWSRDVGERLRAYGPEVEILCVHAGTRQDETELHRNLRPFLARGREWYEDGPGMADIVAKAVERHGAPDIKVRWTRPAEPPVRKRRR